MVRCIGIAVVIAVCIGCGGENVGKLPTLGKVTGIVTLDGAPLDQARVEFVPATSRPSTGMTNSSGKYELSFDASNKGAAVGQHKVVISTKLNPANDKTDKVPAKYNDKTELTADVKGGNNSLDFKLLSK